MFVKVVQSCAILTEKRNHMKLTLSRLIKTIKPFADDIGLSDEQFVLTFLKSVSGDGNFTIDKSVVSRVLSGQYDVPEDARRSAVAAGYEAVCRNSAGYYHSELNPAREEQLGNGLRELVKSSDVSKAIEADSLSKKTEELFPELVWLAMTEDNRERVNDVVYKKGGCYLRIISGDIISIGFGKRDAKGPRIVVIPVDFGYTMKLTGESGSPLVASDSIHGRWLMKMAGLGLSPRRIRNRLKSRGTDVMAVRVDETTFYLLPVSSLDENGKAASSRKKIVDAYSSLSSAYDTYGQGLPVYVPLLGTGRSRAGLGLRESAGIGKNAFLARGSLNGRVSLVVYRKDVARWEEEE